jgi:hypothetical protein
MRTQGLKAGDRIRILKTFQDFDGQEIVAGRELTLADYSVFFYYAGHTLRFTDGTVIRLSGDVPENEVIIEDRDDVYWKKIPEGA